MVNLKRVYLHYEVADNKFCGCKFTDLNPVKPEFSVSCCYFDVGVALNEILYKYLKYIVAYGIFFSYYIYHC